MLDSLIHGDCVDVLRLIADDSFDSVLTDPPYGLGEVKDISELLLSWAQGKDGEKHAGKSGFMNKEWDAAVPSPRVWKSIYRVMKPGAYLLVFAGTRTWDLMSMAIRLAGFESRDTIATEFGEVSTLSWCYGEGFPKSLNITKALDRLYGYDQEVIGHMPGTGIRSLQKSSQEQGARTYEKGLSEDLHPQDIPISRAASKVAQEWNGWGTNLKPAFEPILVFRKPIIEKSIAHNIVKYGTGALNIDACRVPAPGAELGRMNKEGENGWKNSSGGPNRAAYDPVAASGRWPANLLLVHSDICSKEHCDESCPAWRLDQQSGVRKSGGKAGKKYQFNRTGVNGIYSPAQGEGKSISDTGTASRYFNQFYYEPKAKKKERDAGCEMIEKQHPLLDSTEIITIQLSFNSKARSQRWEQEEKRAMLRVDTAQSPPKVIDVSGTLSNSVSEWNTFLFGSETMPPSLQECKFTIETKTNLITPSKTLNWLIHSLTNASIADVNLEMESGGNHAANAKESSEFQLVFTNEETVYLPGAKSVASQTQWIISARDEKGGEQSGMSTKNTHPT